MLNNGFVPKVTQFGNVNFTNLSSIGNIGKISMDMDTSGVESFGSVIKNMAQQLNTTMEAPDKMLTDAIQGVNGTDIHDVMMAISKAEIGVNIATSATTKIVQAYEKIMAIQV